MPLNFFSATIAANSASKKLTAFDKRTQALLCYGLCQ